MKNSRKTQKRERALRVFLGNSLITVLLLVFSAQAFANPFKATALESLPVQDGGRIKPFDTFARESLQLIYGRSSYHKESATNILMTWMLAPDVWDEKEIVLLRRNDIKEALKLIPNRTHFSPKELLSSDRLPILLQDLSNKREAKEKLNPYYQDLQRLENQLGLYRSIVSGFALRLIPPTQGDTWTSLHEISRRDDPSHTGTNQVGPDFSSLVFQWTQAFTATLEKEDKSQLEKSVTDLKNSARSVRPELYPTENDIFVEVHFNKLDPFQWTWIFYLISTLLLAMSLTKTTPTTSTLYSAGWLVSILGLSMHIYGFVLRCYLTGRPPVSNMYESVVWVSLGTVLFGMLFEYLRKNVFVLLGAMLVGVLCQIVASFAPTILDPSLQPLEPVLRSNMWLTVHVLTITLSYSAFFLALLIADFGLYYFVTQSIPRAKDLAQTAYRVIQVGVVLLFAGTVLGGVWADYSWGRFWGWDPKETWAFIAFMGYIAILHARKAGYVKEFGFMVSVICAFSLVLMAWYGVNYVLGAGLHSYGFGGGGIPYVASFIGVHFVYCVFAYVVYASSATLKKQQS